MTNALLTPELFKQADDILSGLTLREKIAQMTQVERSSCSPAQVKKYKFGSVLSGAGSFPGENSPQEWLDMVDEYWLASRGADGQGIPVLFGTDAIHGHCNLRHATIFPHNIGLGAAADSTLAFNIAQATAKEMMATGVDWAFAPNLAIAKDIRWGRFYESISERPDVVAEFAPLLVSGLQSAHQQQRIIACAKHFIGDGGTYKGIDQGDTRLPLQQLEETHIVPFKQAIAADVMTVMVSFSSVNGVKCHGSKELINDILKEKMGFQGFVVTDMEALDFLSNDYYEAIGKSVNAGIDMFMLPERWEQFMDYLLEHAQLGSVPISRIDDAVRRIIAVKLAVGLFDLPRPSQRPMAITSNIGCEAHQSLALEAVHKSQVLLKNDGDLLPLSAQKPVLVCGKNAHNVGHQCGGFSIDWQGFSGNDALVGGTTVFDGIRSHAEHCKLITEPDIDAVSSEQFDVAIVVIGETPYAEGLGDIRDCSNSIVETGSMIQGKLNVTEPYGDSYHLKTLHPEDYALIETLKAKGIKVVTVLISGRPLVINDELAASDAFVAAWLPGGQGHGVADVLFGAQPFTGRLPFAWPSAILPDTGHRPTEYSELFPLGYGLNT